MEDTRLIESFCLSCNTQLNSTRFYSGWSAHKCTTSHLQVYIRKEYGSMTQHTFIYMMYIHEYNKNQLYYAREVLLCLVNQELLLMNTLAIDSYLLLNTIF